MSRVIRSFSIVLVFSLLLGVFCSFDIYQAAEMEEYDVNKINVAYSYSVNNGSYVTGNSPGVASYTSCLIFRLDDGCIAGNSTISFEFMYVLDGSNFASFKIDGIRFYDDNHNRITPSNFNYNNYSTFNYLSSATIKVLMNPYSFNLGRDTNIRYIYVYFTQQCVDDRGEFSCPAIGYLKYHTPDYTEEMVTPTPEDQENVNNSNSSLNDNKEQMDSMLDDMASVPEPSPDDLVANLDKYLPTEHITAFSSVLGSLFQNDIVIAYVMIGLVVSLVSFVLFGKKG